jgi:hypothetical protein
MTVRSPILSAAALREARTVAIRVDHDIEAKHFVSRGVGGA